MISNTFKACFFLIKTKYLFESKHLQHKLKHCSIQFLKIIRIQYIDIWLKFSFANAIKCLLIEFVIPNMSKIYFCLPEIFKTNFSNRLFSTISPFEFVFSSCEFKKLMWNVRRKSFLYTKINYLSDLKRKKI